MTRLAIVEYTDTENLKLVHDLGECDQEGYFLLMGQLTQAQDDWDSFCNTVLDTLQQMGVLQEDTLSSAGHTYNDILRMMRGFANELVEVAKENRKNGYESSKVDAFLLSSDGSLLVLAMRGLAKIGKKGKDIEINKEQAEAVFWALLEPIRRQLMRAPERQQRVQPIIDRYFPTPGHVLDA